MLSSSIHLSENFVVNFFFFIAKLVFHCACVPHFHYSVIGWKAFGLFQFSGYWEWTGNVQEWASVSGAGCQGIAELGRIGDLLGAFWEFPTGLYNSCSSFNPTNSEENSLFLAPWPTFVLSCILNFSHLNWGKIKFQSYFNVYFSHF